MKRLLLSMLLLSATVFTYAQCDKKNVLTSSKTEYLNTDNEVQRSVDENSVVEFDGKEITITPGDDPVVKGTIKSVTCDWKTAYKEGKTIMKANVVAPDGKEFNLTLTIEGKDGKINMLVEFEDSPDRKIRIVADKFEEKK